MSAKPGGKREKRLYGSDHAKLNITMPPATMWMNMGFWQGTEDFPTACRSLLEQVLKSAGILSDGNVERKMSGTQTLSIIDLGFGCGDQSLYIKHTLSPETQPPEGVIRNSILRSYVGITLDSDQYDIAQERLDQEKQSESPPVKLYCADAGKSDAWSPQLQEDISFACKSVEDLEHHENWILGLDTLYHFQPTKWPVINYASNVLGANLMAYDLCMSDNLSLWQRLVLRLMAFLGHSPWANWATTDQYRDQLVAAGYDRDKIEIIDISEHVFRPLARFIRRRDVEMKRYGMSIGRFRHGAAMFDWWGRAGIVKGCIIIART